jgi:hypothetical protein
MKNSIFVTALLVFSSLSSHAAVITNSVVLDLSTVSITDDASGGQLLSGNDISKVIIPSFTPVVGDTLVTTIAFANGDRLRINNGPNVVDSTGPTFFESLVFEFDSSGATVSGSHASSTTNTTFTGLQGSLIDVTGSVSGILGQGIGGLLSIDITDSFISFTGLTITSNITGLTSSGSSFDRFGLFGGRAGGFEVISVPAPGSILLMSLGMVALRWVRCRQQNA